MKVRHLSSCTPCALTRRATSRFCGFLLLLCFSAATQRLAAESQSRLNPVFLYSRYFNAEGETRYLPDGNYKDVLDRLRPEFKVRVHNQPLIDQSLSDVKVVLIANPSDQPVGAHPPPHHFSPADIEALVQFVRNGGGLILMENQENHNLEINDSNKLLARFGIQATNAYTDAKQLILPRNIPILGGLRWAYYTGNSLLLDSAHPARPRALVTNDLKQPPLKGLRDQPGVLMAAANLGRGRILVVTDSGWIADWAFSGEGVGGVSIKEQDNWEIFHRLTRWVAHSKQGSPLQE
jgi:hypothetical protein